jgi:hypothetical protein
VQGQAVPGFGQGGSGGSAGSAGDGVNNYEDIHGGDGGVGGAGGNGGPAGMGGGGSGGAGGTIRLVGTQVVTQGAVVRTAGGAGVVAGSDGRLMLGSNINASAASVSGRFQTPLLSEGPMAANPYSSSLDPTPYIAGLFGGAEIFGLWGTNACGMAVFSDVCLRQPREGVAALVRLDDIPGLDFGDAFDALFYISLTESVLTRTSLAVGGAELRLLRIGGAERDQDFGGSGPVELAALNAGSVWVTLIAADATDFSLGGAKLGLSNTASAAQLANGGALYLSIPEPAPLALAVPWLIGMLWLRRRVRPSAGGSVLGGADRQG